MFVAAFHRRECFPASPRSQQFHLCVQFNITNRETIIEGFIIIQGCVRHLRLSNLITDTPSMPSQWYSLASSWRSVGQIDDCHDDKDQRQDFVGEIHVWIFLRLWAKILRGNRNLAVESIARFSISLPRYLSDSWHIGFGSVEYAFRNRSQRSLSDDDDVVTKWSLTC